MVQSVKYQGGVKPLTQVELVHVCLFESRSDTPA
jgi:hypothetical protein